MTELISAVDKFIEAKQNYHDSITELCTTLQVKVREIKAQLNTMKYDDLGFYDLVGEIYTISPVRQNPNIPCYSPHVTTYSYKWGDKYFKEDFLNPADYTLEIIDTEGNIKVLDETGTSYIFKHEWLEKSAKEVAEEIFNDLIPDYNRIKSFKAEAAAKAKEDRLKLFYELKDEFEGGNHE